MKSTINLSRILAPAFVLALAAVSGAFRAAAQDIQLQLSRDEDVMELQWEPARGVLQMSDSLSGDWLNVSVDNPSWFYRSNAAFFRVWDVPATDVIPLEAGVDLYQSAGSLALTIPADFFGPGSDPFDGLIEFVGAPLETGGAFELGTCDTVVRRPDPVNLPPPDSALAVPVELVELSLVSPAPIVVTFASEPPQEYQVFLQAGPLPDTEAAGQMTVRRGSGWMAFDLELPVLPMVAVSYTHLTLPTIYSV